MRDVGPHDMTAPRTSTLLIVGVVLFLFGCSLMRPALKHKVVVGPNGVAIRTLDRFGTFMINWDAHLFQGLGCGCLAWGTGRCIIRLVRSSHTGKA